MHTKRIIDHIVDWLRSYCGSADLKGYVVGVSGGIDSAVTATLCARTGLPLIALNMPIYQAAGQVSLSRAHIAWLENEYGRGCAPDRETGQDWAGGGVLGMHIDLTPGFQALEESFPPRIQDELTMANTRSRMRMLTLYAVASHYRMLVAGTGNRVEDFGIGFFTKYGDGGVDVSPIADLMKSEVYALGKELGVREAILNAAPTDGLWEDNRTDEHQIGATYAELEWAMKFKEAASRRSDRLSRRQKAVLAIYQELNRVNRHKMGPIPVCKIPDHLR